MKPKVPEKFYVVKRKNHAIVKWDKVTEDIEGNPLTIDHYHVYRTSKTNSKEFVLVATVNTTDILGAVDTIYIDIDIEDNEIYFYKIVAVNVALEESDFTQEESGIYFGDIQDNRPEEAETIAARWDISLWDSVTDLWG